MLTNGIKILVHFDRSNNANYILYRLKDGEWDEFIMKLTLGFRLCYIEDEKLNELASNANITKSKFLERFILPDEPIIKSGDFGELLSFFSVKENLENKGLVLTLPLKWQWKDNRNKAAPGADGIIFHIPNAKKYSSDDLVVTIESKMKSTYSKEGRIQDAIDGAAKDKLSRMAKTLNWMEEKYAKEGQEENRKIVARFKDPATYGTFKKVHKAIAILDIAFEADEIAKPINNSESVSVIIFSIQELQKAYEKTRVNMINSI